MCSGIPWVVVNRDRFRWFFFLLCETTELFSIVWRGDIEVPYTGAYRFDLRVAGAAKCTPPTLTLDGADYHCGDTLRLKGGARVPFVVRYAKNTQKPACTLLWQIVPDEGADDAFAGEVAAAKGADAVIAVVGLGLQYEREGRDKLDLSLPREQMTLLKKLRAVNENLIVVLENGSAVAMPWVAEHAAAILDVWYPGECGGTAIADLLFGKVSPAGRLPLAFPKKTEDLPPFDDYEMKNGRSYMYRKIEPLYDFGFGLSYTSFAYSDLKKTPDGAAVTVTNTGACASDEVVQLYLDSAGLPDQPTVRLKGFRRIHLQPGEAKEVAFSLNDESFSLFGSDGVRRVYPGVYRVYIDGHLPNSASCFVQIERD